MKPENEEKVTGLPENAYRELKEGESYKPLMSPNKHYPEVTPWSVLWGLVMAVIFSAAAAYLGLEGRSSIRGRHPDRYHRRRVVQRIQAEERLGRERHHPVYRGQ